jgi:AraC family transcriptional regulator
MHWQSFKCEARMNAMVRLSALCIDQGLPARTQTDAPVYKGGTILARTERHWTGIRVMVTDLRAAGQVEFELRASSPLLSVMLEEVGGRVMMAAGPGIALRGMAPQNAISVLAAGSSARAHGSGVTFLRHLLVKIDGPTVARLADEPIDLGRALATRLMIADERLMTICHRFAEDCISGEPANRLYGDGLSVALLRRLEALSDVPPEIRARGGLAPWQLRRVLDHLQTNLAENPTVAALARIAGLCPSYFRQAFKATTGTTPHQWLIEARCVRAKHLLLDSSMALAEIALEVGFCDQAHFTRCFRRVVGASPGGWRREHC